MIGDHLHAIILAGGYGTRFWPLSREAYPKQMLQIVGEDSLLRQTIKRINGSIREENTWIVTTEDKVQDTLFHIESLGSWVKKIKFIKEPLGKNTAPAIGLAAIYLHHRSSESVMVVMPSDHAIPDREEFLSDLKRSIRGTKEDQLVTFGIRPTRPETGYGYIKVNPSSRMDPNKLFKVERFFEKPDLETAKTFLADGSYFWNSGIFVWKTSVILSEIERHLPSLYKTLKEIEAILFQPSRVNGSDRIRELYNSIESISIDYGVIERSRCVLMVPATFRWSDVGSWVALDEITAKDDSGNIFSGNTIDRGSQNSIVFSGERLVATIGLKDMVVVDTPDATLVTSKERVQEVKKIVEALRESGREEHLFHKNAERPWGSYMVLEKGNGYKVKRLVLKPGAKLSLQIHRRRSEHWVVVSGIAKVTREDETYLIHKDENAYIPVNIKHRLENIGEEPLEVIEIQNGDYLEEDDIERFDDVYGR
jgi:mannose-1-phosphate guanylyltransferase/mannose-6-phosphate isomerase